MKKAYLFAFILSTPYLFYAQDRDTLVVVNPSNKLANLTAVAATTANPLKSGTFFKIKVDKSGVFKITTKFLKDNGINPAYINPKNFRIYGNGGLMLPEYNQDNYYKTLQENAIQVVGEEDGRWDNEDYALFYAQGPHGFNIYNGGYNSSERNLRTETRIDRSSHHQNIYEDHAYYFINFDIGAGKRITDADETVPSELITRYDDYQFINEDKTNLLKLGRVWVSDPITKDLSIKFTKKSPIRSEDIIQYRTSVVAYKAQNNSAKFDINGQKTYTYNVRPEAIDFVKVTLFNGTVSQLSGNEITINISPNTSANPGGNFYFDYAEVMYKEDLVYNDAQMNFRSYDIYEGASDRYGFSISNATSLEQVWDVSDVTNAKRKVNKAGNVTLFNFGYTADSDIFNNEFIAFKHSAAYIPSFVGRIEKQDLSSLQNIDYLAITRKEFLPQAQRLVDYHAKNGMKTALIDVEQVYNEFGSGSRDITAIRDFVSHLKNNRGGLKYLFILGDTSYDFKNKTTTNDNIVSSYQSEDSSNFSSTFVTDDYFTFTKPQTSASLSNQLPTLPVGRLPASNLAQAQNLIDKTLSYYNALPNQTSSPFGVWRMNMDFIVDDYDSTDFTKSGPIPFHNYINGVVKNTFENGEREEYHIRKLYADAFPATTSAGGQRYPDINQQIFNNIGNSLYMFYYGHGGVNGWSQERILTSKEVEGFNNYTSTSAHFPLVSTITCEFTLWDNPDMFSVGEQVMKHREGGAATMITSSREIGVGYGKSITDKILANTFTTHNYEFNTLGDAYLKAKEQLGRHTDHLKVNYLGDPAMKLSRPKPFIRVTEIKTPTPDLIRALDFIEISGEIHKADGTIDDTFNGNITVNVFDKKFEKEVRNNDNLNIAPENKLKFIQEGSPIVKTAGKAENGKFTVKFYVPKDINYEVGNGRILLYADNFNALQGEEKRNAYDVFGNNSYKIGGLNENGINDQEPPKVKLYMNNTNFADGGITDRNPTFLACVTDNIGINSTGAGIGHNITVILDGEVVNTIVLNDFYNGGEGNGCINPNLEDFQKGSVLYPFKNLKTGEHQLTFKVWDINNNSTTSSLNFIVKDEADQKLVLNKLLNWPNPFTDKTYIHFEHNCDDILEVNVQIYTITGKLVRTLSMPVSSVPFMEGYRTPKTAIEWDGKDDFGATVGKGTYIYKVFAKSQNQDKCKGSATAVEKMVLLK